MLAIVTVLLLVPNDSPMVKYLGTCTRHGGEWLSFEVKNPNNTAIQCAAYTPESFTDGIPEGEMRPFYIIEVREGKEWKRLELGHCATGRGLVTLKANAKVTFETVIPEGEWTEAKVGLAWSKDDKRSSSAIAWSSVIKRSDLANRKP